MPPNGILGLLGQFFPQLMQQPGAAQMFGQTSANAPTSNAPNPNPFGMVGMGGAIPYNGGQFSSPLPQQGMGMGFQPQSMRQQPTTNPAAGGLGK